MDNNDSLTVTPEKIKDLLSSFLVKPNKMKESGKNPAETRNTESDSDSLGTTKS
ncbi:nuclear-interacting partner of ALK, partial [Biomphalaria pfeifferi]